MRIAHRKFVVFTCPSLSLAARWTERRSHRRESSGRATPRDALERTAGLIFEIHGGVRPQSLAAHGRNASA
jgi:hypothetical protein